MQEFVGVVGCDRPESANRWECTRGKLDPVIVIPIERTSLRVSLVANPQVFFGGISVDAEQRADRPAEIVIFQPFAAAE